MEDGEMDILILIVHNPFLTKPNNCNRKQDGYNQADNIADKRYEKVGSVRVVCYSLRDAGVHLYSAQLPYDSEEYPGPRKHDEYSDE
jgi:hypothetical protein